MPVCGIQLLLGNFPSLGLARKSINWLSRLLKPNKCRSAAQWAHVIQNLASGCDMWLSHSPTLKKPPRQYIHSICWCVVNIIGWRSAIRTRRTAGAFRGRWCTRWLYWFPMSRCHDLRVSLGVVSRESGLIYLPRNLSSTELNPAWSRPTYIIYPGASIYQKETDKASNRRD